MSLYFELTPCSLLDLSSGRGIVTLILNASGVYSNFSIKLTSLDITDTATGWLNIMCSAVKPSRLAALFLFNFCTISETKLAEHDDALDLLQEKETPRLLQNLERAVLK